jgi:hypothetical protein
VRPSTATVSADHLPLLIPAVNATLANGTGFGVPQTVESSSSIFFDNGTNVTSETTSTTLPSEPPIKVPMKLYKFDVHQRDCASVWFPATAWAHVQCCMEVSVDPRATTARSFTFTDQADGLLKRYQTELI